MYSWDPISNLHVASFKTNTTGSAMMVVAAYVLGQFPVGSKLTNSLHRFTDN